MYGLVTDISAMGGAFDEGDVLSDQLP